MSTNNLNGKTILIGRESAQGRLLVAISGSSMTVGGTNSVPSSVSRCKPAENIAHCKISIDQSGNMVIANIKPQNVTYVDGLQVESKKITEHSTIALGRDKYSVSVHLILEAASKLVPTSPSPSQPAIQSTASKKVYNISHLEHVWIDTQDKRRKIQSTQRRINLIRSGCGIFTMCAMPCIYFLGPIGYVLTAIGIIGNIYSFVGLKGGDPSLELERISEDMQDRYVCPNPDCNKFLGNMSYKLIKRQYSMHCPYCKCEYVEK